MLDLLRKRRSIRKYKDSAIEPWKIDVLKEAILRSPSSKNKQPWDFIFVSDPEMLSKLAESKKKGSDCLKDAKLGIVVAAKTTTSDVWVEDCSVASTIVHLTAHFLDLGSCWIQIRNRYHSDSVKASDYIKDLLEIPESYEVESIIAIGNSAEEKEGVRMDDLPWSKLHENRF